MRVVIAPDKFKGSLTASQAASAMGEGVLRSTPNAVIDRVPMADGGEGTVEALVQATGGSFHEASVTDPLGRPVRARFGLLGGGSTAVIEMAAASGLTLVPKSARDPRRTSTRGTGELLLAAIEHGASRVIIGIGGSATNDGGAGLAEALGFRFLDSQGHPIGPGGGALARLHKIEASNKDSRIASVAVDVACDVTNPLCGPQGASAVYGPQKGATPEMVRDLDRNLGHLAEIIQHDLGIDVADLRGAGAAGGLGAGLVAFASGRLQPGVQLVIEAVKLADRLREADLCLTGEGALDGSSVFGKTAVGVARLARESGCPTLAVVGTIGEGARSVLREGIDAFFSLCSRPMTLNTAVAEAEVLLKEATEQAVRAFLAGRRRTDVS